MIRRNVLLQLPTWILKNNEFYMQQPKLHHSFGAGTGTVHCVCGWDGMYPGEFVDDTREGVVNKLEGRAGKHSASSEWAEGSSEASTGTGEVQALH